QPLLKADLINWRGQSPVKYHQPFRSSK
ncbi:hypothetical protein TorRG33x02_115260, partial [Trema orientale]